MNDLIAGCLQCEVSGFNLEENLERLGGALADLHREGCGLLVLPEMWCCGFSLPDLESVANQTPLVLDFWRERCRHFSLVLVGSMPETDGGRLFNTSYVVDASGRVAARYRKSHLFSPNGEHLRFERGREAVVCPTDVGRLGIMICYDLRFPELARRLALDGAEILCVSALWPRVRVDHWDLLLRSRALENQVFVVGCNGCGPDGDLQYGGASAIISPMGRRLSLAGEGTCSIQARIDLAEIEAFRRTIPCWDDRRPDIYGQL
jgi:predicted amidohydrolase